MKVTMRTLSAGPDGIRQPGETAEVTEAEARALILGRYAEPADPASERLQSLIAAEAEAEVASLKSKGKRA